MAAIDFFGYSFDVDYPLFTTEFEELPGIYVIYTEKNCLDLGKTENLKESIETHDNTREWLRLAGKEDLYVAFYWEENTENREEIENYLRPKMKPIISSGSPK